MRGYLVLLVEDEPGEAPRPNAKYQGVDRLPPNPTVFPDEVEALDEYVYGDYKEEDSSLIPTLHRARELLTMFDDASRDFELVYCEADDFVNELQAGADYELLGYDVAGVSGDCWSIVADFTAEPGFEEQSSKLNNFGLFDHAHDAEKYFRDYKAAKLPDYDCGFSVCKVWRVR